MVLYQIFSGIAPLDLRFDRKDLWQWAGETKRGRHKDERITGIRKKYGRTEHLEKFFQQI
jgi:hypothetical protein